MAKQHQQLAFDWGQSELPKAPTQRPESSAPSAPTPQTFDFDTTFPPPRPEAVSAGVLGTDEPDEAAVRGIHREHANELLAILSGLAAIEAAQLRGIDPRTGSKPRGEAAHRKLTLYFHDEPCRLEERFQSLLDVYANAFGDAAAELFEKHVRSEHQKRLAAVESELHFPMPVPVPLPEAVEKGQFGMEDEQTPVEPTEDEVFALTEHHSQRLIELLEQLEAIEDRLAEATGQARTLVLQEKERALCAYQGAIALYAEDFGQAAATRLEAWAKAQLGKPALPQLSDAQPSSAPQYDPGHPWHYLKRGDGCAPVPLDEIPASECDGRFVDKLPRDAKKRHARLRELLAEEEQHLQEFSTHYTSLIEQGVSVLSQYDRTIAYGGDDELAFASSVALRFNHIAHSRGRIRWLQQQLGSALPFDAVSTDGPSKSSAVVDTGSAAPQVEGVQRPASTAEPTLVPPLRHAVAETQATSGTAGIDSSPVGGSPAGERTTNGGPMQPTIAPTPSPTRNAPATNRAEKLEKLHDSVEQALDKLAASLEAGHSDTLKSWLTTMSRFHSYSLNNQMLIAWQRPDATHVAGFHAWKKFNRLVNKGEKGIMILAPVTRVVGSKLETDRQGRSVEKPIRAIVNAKVVYVFDVSQTHGEPLPELNTIKGDPAAFTPKLKELILAKGIELYFAASLGGALGCSEGGRIGVLQGLTPAEEFHVLTHELAHELLHRGDRRKETTKRSRELEAESVAFVVCNAVGLDATASSTDYIHLYRGDKQMLHESLQFIRQVSGEILNHLKGAQTAEND